MELIIGIIELFFLLGASLGISFIFIKSDIADDALASSILRVTLGLGIISYLTLLFASVHFLHRSVFVGVLLIGIGLAFKNRKLFHPGQFSPKMSLLHIVLLVFASINFFYSLFPPTFYDSLLYHLAVPQYYLQHGGIVPWNCNFNSNLPLQVEMLYLFSLLGGTVYIPRLLSFFAGAGILALMFSWSKNHSSTKYPLLPLIFFYTIPEIGFLASSSKTDILGMLFLFAGFYSFFLYQQNPAQKRNVFLSGIFWGMAIGTKYIFAFYFLAFIFTIFLFSTLPFRKKLVSAILVSFLVFLCLLPWLVKNMLITGNPVYPYANTIFKSQFWSADQGDNFSNALKRGQGFHIFDFLRFPLELFVKPYKYGITAVWGVLFLMVLPFLFFCKRNSSNRFLIFSSFLAFSLLIIFARVPRYFLSSMLLLAVPVGSGLENALEKKLISRKFITALLIFVLSIHLVLQFQLQETFFQGIKYIKIKFLTGKSNRSLEYLNIVPYYRAAKFINQNLTRNDLMILLGEERTFYLQKPFIACSFADHHPLIQTIKKKSGFENFRREFQTMGITHMLYSESGLRRLGRLSKIYRLSDKHREILKQYLERFDTIYQDFRYTLYRLK